MLPDEKLTATSSFSVKDGKLVQHPPAPRRVSRRHSVGFKPDTEMQQVIEFDMHDEEMALRMWYSRDEYDIIKARNSLIVKMMKTGHFKESEEHTFRGLEHKLKEGFRQRRANKFNGLNAVLEEQDRQYAKGITIPEAIAEKYGRISIQASETAFVMARRDFENSYCYSGKPVGSQLAAAISTTDESKSRDDVDSHHHQYHRQGYIVDDDTIASEDSNNSSASKTRKKISGLFNAVSMAKRKEGKMFRRSSM
uniref:Uncharacterized protein n=1 Tax=Amphora coffeiformis TaxID=265554 RepID=A0A7S3P8S8_9STRA|mmetsp:Transcript_4601/g.9281  ORF Transcript_4601/g.9281 Transcript_4601/m.9281 type:complete len:252 (-) Transcript_4601:175-930(-)|eukprot:scaffold353_cov185-Amphora_coffeaeformis.AAC.84